MERQKIVQKFASVAEHPEQCYDFDLQGNLDTFFYCERNDINFSEAAFLIFDAARIYGRKVDYFEQVLLDFNQRSATNVSKALAEREHDTENEDGSGGGGSKKDKKVEEQREKREREKERALKRAKRMLKVTSRVEFKPKPFEMVSSDQISLNLHEQRSELECEEEFDQLRMKNVFPRINVLQSNLQNNNTFYDNLGIEESDCDNLDSLRDFRIFMDTIDEPIFTRPMTGNQVDPKYEQEYKRSMERANQKHSNIYLPADYIKENYGITLKDNSDYLNMLKYNEEVERLNLRKLTIEQLSKLKVGTYLNNILHGNKQDGKIAEHDSGIDIDDMDRDCEPSVPDFDCDNTNGFDELRDEQDVHMTDLSTADTSKEDVDMLDISAIPSDEIIEQSHNITTEPSTAEQSLNSTAEQSLNTTNDSLLETSVDAGNSSLEVSKELQGRSSSRQSLDDGIGISECNSPTRLEDLDSFEGFQTTDLVDCIEIDHLNGILNAAGEPIDTAILKAKVPELDTNIFQLPENLLRRNKIFILTDDFELWMAARKRKYGVQKEPPNCGKLLKLSNGVLIRCDPDSDTEEFLGFDENNTMRTAPGTVVLEQSPCVIANRTYSSDSGISPEKALNTGDECNQSSINPSGTGEINDSGVAELNGTPSEATNNSANENFIISTQETLNGTIENAEQSVQETDMSLSDANVNANSTKLFNETASIVTGFDSGFSELESQLESSTGIDDTNHLEATTNLHTSKEIETTETQNGDAEPFGGKLNHQIYIYFINLSIHISKNNSSSFQNVDEAIDCEDDHIEEDSNEEQQEETARAEGFTDMVERVSKWHQMLRPVLANCEKRNNFDIHALGTDIIDMFPSEEVEINPTEISFNDIMKGRDQTYTARYFLSLLLLTNTKNVHLKVMHPEQNGTVLCSKDDIRIKLRSRTRHLDEVNKIDQHLNDPQSRMSFINSGKTINTSYDEGDSPVQSTSKATNGKKTAQKRKRNAEII